MRAIPRPLSIQSLPISLLRPHLQGASNNTYEVEDNRSIDRSRISWTNFFLAPGYEGRVNRHEIVSSRSSLNGACWGPLDWHGIIIIINIIAIITVITVIKCHCLLLTCKPVETVSRQYPKTASLLHTHVYKRAELIPSDDFPASMTSLGTRMSDPGPHQRRLHPTAKYLELQAGAHPMKHSRCQHRWLHPPLARPYQPALFLPSRSLFFPHAQAASLPDSPSSALW